MEVFPGIFQLKVPIPDNPLGYLNAYLIKGDNGWTLVDTGWNVPSAYDSLMKQLSELNVKPEDISTIVITHMHPDHYGLASQVRQASGAKLALHKIDDERARERYGRLGGVWKSRGNFLVRNGMPEQDMRTLGQKYMSMRSELDQPAIPADITFNGGEKLNTGPFEMEIVWTPGHSDGHICLYEREKKILFSGDHILPVITPHISLMGDTDANPLANYIASLKSMMNMDVEVIFPAHEHVFHDLQTRINELLSHHEERMTAMLEGMGSKPRTAYDIACMVSWMPTERKGGFNFSELPPSQKTPALMETLAHMQMMLSEGKVNRTVTDNMVLFQAA